MTPADLAAAVLDAARSALTERGLDQSALPTSAGVERPRNPEHGDYASTLALQVAKKVGVNPRELATAIAGYLEKTPGIKTAEIAGPGFLNIRLDAAAAGQLARVVVEAGSGYGQSATLAGQKINLDAVLGRRVRRRRRNGCRSRRRPAPETRG